MIDAYLDVKRRVLALHSVSSPDVSPWQKVIDAYLHVSPWRKGPLPGPPPSQQFGAWARPAGEAL